MSICGVWIVSRFNSQILVAWRTRCLVKLLERLNITLCRHRKHIAMSDVQISSLLMALPKQTLSAEISYPNANTHLSKDSVVTQAGFNERIQRLDNYTEARILFITNITSCSYWCSSKTFQASANHYFGSIVSVQRRDCTSA
jgi:hypothetical protein